jgi:DNA-directed RNA polymerase I, II, and III subunit RPABC2
MSILDPKNYVDNSLHKIDIVTPNDYRISSEIMSIAEYTRVISERSSHIQKGAKIFIEVGLESDPIKIAKNELKQKKSPMEIRRYTSRNILEVWSVNEMIIPFGCN